MDMLREEFTSEHTFLKELVESLQVQVDSKVKIIETN